MYIFFTRLISLVTIVVAMCQLSHRFKYYFKLFVYSTLILIICVIPYPYMFFRGKSAKNGTLYSAFVRGLAWCFGINFIIEGEENIKEKSCGIIMVNHQCFLDMLAVAKLFPLFGTCSIVMKKELQYIPLFGLSAILSDTVFIKREERFNSIQEINKKKSILSEKKNMMLFFPEGTRNRSRQMKAFKKGPFYMAVELNCPIYPVVVAPFFSYDYERKIFNSGTFKIKILPAVSTEGLNAGDVAELLKTVQNEMQHEYEQLWDDSIKQAAFVKEI